MLQILSQQKRALGSVVTLTLVGLDLTTLEEQMVKLWSIVDEFESSFSRFLLTSELTQVNISSGKKTTVSKEFISLIKVCSDAFKLTGGVFNPLILPVLQLSGYKNSFSEYSKHIKAPDFSKRKTYDFSEVKYGENWVILPKNSALDFGGCGKGFLADKLADTTDVNQKISGYWFSLGGDIVTNGLDQNNEPWSVAIQDAKKADQDIGEILATGDRLAIATSGIIKRGGLGWHHLIDIKTNAPAVTDILTATICDVSATKADIMASCAVIVGAKNSPEFLKKVGIYEYFIQTSNDYIRSGGLIKRYNSK